MTPSHGPLTPSIKSIKILGVRGVAAREEEEWVLHSVIEEGTYKGRSKSGHLRNNHGEATGLLQGTGRWARCPEWTSGLRKMGVLGKILKQAYGHYFIFYYFILF